MFPAKGFGYCNTAEVTVVFPDCTITGGRGSDVIYGGNGADTIRDNAGADTIYPGSGNNTLLGVAQEDTVFDLSVDGEF